MGGIESVKAIVAESGMTQADVARAIGYEGEYPAQFMQKKFGARKNMDVDAASEILAAVGYRLVAIPSGCKTPKGGRDIG